MSKRRAGYTESGQPIGTQGEPDPAAVAAVAEANKTIVPIPEPAEQSAEGAQEAIPTSPPASNAPPETATLQQIAADPEAVRKLFQTAAQDPELRQMLNIQPGVGPPSGFYERNYQGETALHVPGGLEVEHPRKWRPKAPAKIKMYLADDGTPTDYLAAQVPSNQRGTLKPAALDANGNPVLTEGYKQWLDARFAGGRIDSRVQMNIAVGQTNAGDGSVALVDQATGAEAAFEDAGVELGEPNAPSSIA